MTRLTFHPNTEFPGYTSPDNRTGYVILTKNEGYRLATAVYVRDWDIPEYPARFVAFFNVLSEEMMYPEEYTAWAALPPPAAFQINSEALGLMTVEGLVYNEARKLFKSEEDTLEWLNARSMIFEGKSPAELAETQEGRVKVLDVISRLSYGLYNQ